jgi:hypothetical protein
MVDDSKPASGLKDKVGPQELVIAAVVVVLGLWFAISHSESENAPVSAQAAPQPAPRETPPAPVPPQHNYVYVDDDGHYGYQPTLSANDQQAGVAQNSLVMVRYLGEKKGVYQVAIDQGGSTAVASCAPPCAYMTVITYAYGTQVDKGVMATAGTVGGEMLADAMAGQLKVYHAKPGAGSSE